MTTLKIPDLGGASQVEIIELLVQNGDQVEVDQPMLVLETALPAKFAETIVEATGRQPERPHWIKGLEGLEELPKRFVVVPNDTQTVKDYIVQHCND